MDDRDHAPHAIDKGASSFIRATGWTPLEDYLKRHDQGMVKGFDDDINTLLVFAGLFSAVLTAFVIESYLWLQPDNTATSAQLLAKISLQLANSSDPLSTPPSTPSQPSTTARSINTLWFLSLISSLASALFGMITKQWLREYLQWTTLSAVAQDLVYLRQERYEAFIEWRVPAIIATIPALIELSLILFLTGMIILLWTLDSVVAGVCTIAAVTLIALALVTSILPLWYPRCPYKSPGCWALLQVSQSCIRLWNMPRRFQSYGRANLEILQHWGDVSTELEALDLRSTALGGQRLKIEDLEGEAERIYILSRALLWIRETSQDLAISAAVDQCCGIRATRKCDVLSSLIIDFHIACRLLNVHPDALCSYVDECCLAFSNTSSTRPARLVWDLDIWYERLDGTHRLVHDQIHRNASPLIQAQVAHFLVLDLLKFFEEETKHTVHYLKIARLLMRILVLSEMLMDISIGRAKVGNFEHCGRSLTSLFELLGHDKEISACLPGFRTILFGYITKCEKFADIKLISDPSRRAADHAILALQILGEDADQWTWEDCDLFVRVSSEALRHWKATKGYQDHLETLKALLERMKACARNALVRQWKDCGSYAELQLENGWFWPLYCLFHPRGPDYTQQMDQLFPHDLLRALAQCDDEGLLTGGLWYLEELLEESILLTNSAHEDAALLASGSNVSEWTNTTVLQSLHRRINHEADVHQNDTAGLWDQDPSLPRFNTPEPNVDSSSVDISEPHNPHRKAFLPKSIRFQRRSIVHATPRFADMDPWNIHADDLIDSPLLRRNYDPELLAVESPSEIQDVHTASFTAQTR